MLARGRRGGTLTHSCREWAGEPELPYLLTCHTGRCRAGTKETWPSCHFSKPHTCHGPWAQPFKVHASTLGPWPGQCIAKKAACGLPEVWWTLPVRNLLQEDINIRWSQ